MVCLFRRYVSFLRNMDGGRWLSLSIVMSLRLSDSRRSFVCLSILLSALPSVHQCICPSIRPSVRPSVRLSVRPSVRPSVRRSVRQSNHPSARQFIRPFCLSVRPSHRSVGPYNLSVCPSFCCLLSVVCCLFLKRTYWKEKSCWNLSTHLSFSPSVYLYILPVHPICLFVSLSNYSSICPSFYCLFKIRSYRKKKYCQNLVHLTFELYFIPYPDTRRHLM